MQGKISKTLLLIVTVILVVSVGWILFSRVLGGSIRIISSADTQIFMYDDKRELVELGYGEATIKSKGNQTILLVRGDSKKIKYLNVQKGQHNTIEVFTEEQFETNKIVSLSGADLSANTNGRVCFRQPTTKELLCASGSSQAVNRMSVHRFNELFWSGTNNFVGKNIFGKFVIGKNFSQTIAGSLDSLGLISLSVNESGQAVATSTDGKLIYFSNIIAGPAEQKVIAEGIQTDALVSISRGGKIAYVERVETGDDEDDEGNTSLLPTAKYRIYDENLNMINEGELSQQINDIQNSPVVGTWSQDDSIFAYTTTSGLVVIDPENGNQWFTIQEFGSVPIDLDWLYDNKALVTTRDGVWLVNVTNQEASLLSGGDFKGPNSTFVNDESVWSSRAKSNVFGSGEIITISL